MGLKLIHVRKSGHWSKSELTFWPGKDGYFNFNNSAVEVIPSPCAIRSISTALSILPVWKYKTTLINEHAIAQGLDMLLWGYWQLEPQSTGNFLSKQSHKHAL